MNLKASAKQGIPNLSKSGDLKGEDLTTTDLEKAELLAEYFNTVFTEEPEGHWDLPTDGHQTQENTVDVSQESVKTEAIKITRSLWYTPSCAGWTSYLNRLVSSSRCHSIPGHFL